MIKFKFSLTKMEWRDVVGAVVVASLVAFDITAFWRVVAGACLIALAVTVTGKRGDEE